MTLCVIIALESRVGQELGSKICSLSGTQMQFPVVVIARHDIIILHLLSEVCPLQSSRAYYTYLSIDILSQEQCLRFHKHCPLWTPTSTGLQSKRVT